MYYTSTLFTGRYDPAYRSRMPKNLRFLIRLKGALFMLMLLSVSTISASAASAQTVSEVYITTAFPPQPLQRAFSLIERATDFRFAYRKEMLPKGNTAALPAASRTVKQVLEALLEGTGLHYRQVSNSIVITSAGASVTAGAVLQEFTGQVVEENGLPLPGVSVRLKNKPGGATTDSNGHFSIRAEYKDILVFSFIGYSSVEKEITGDSPLRISMNGNAGTLDDVVVIGYGTTTKRNNTGSVTTVSAKQIGNQPVSNPLAALQGRVAGLDISAATGYPGGDYTVRLRGQNSIGAGNAPLYIVDGIPFISESISQFSTAGGLQSPLSSINPADIEQIDVLKDADATAIYGSRGANGVILITTKKGRAGKAEVSLNVSRGASSVGHRIGMLNTEQYLALRREAYKNDGKQPAEADAPDLLLWDQQLDQRWQEKLLGKAAALTEAQLSVRGGTAQTNFLLGGTFRNEKSVLPGNMGYKRGAMNSSFNYNPKDSRFTLSSSVKFTTDENNTSLSDLAGSFNLAPNMPVYDAQGNYYWFGTEQNPYALLERKNVSRTTDLLGNVSMSYQLLSGLSAKVNAGFNRMQQKQLQTLPKISFNPETYTGSTANYGSGSVNAYSIEPQLDYQKNMGKGKLSALAGGTWQHSVSDLQSLVGSGYASDAQLENIKAAALLTPRTYNYVKYRYNSVFGRLTYNWDEKYVLNGTFRRDGSSRFGPGRRFGNFGAVGAAWVFSSESLIKEKLPVLSFGKLRVSYGSVGNDQIGNYQYLDSWSSSNYAYGGITGLYPSRFANPDYSWEVNKKLEAGIDLGFLQDRLLITANFYRNRSDNQLIGYTLSAQSGFELYTANLPALVQNKGFELEISSVNFRKKDFSWTTSGNLTVARNKLLKYPGLENSGNAQKYVIGMPLTIVKGYQFSGIDPQTGVPHFRDVNGDGAISDPADMAVIGDTAPEFYGGLQNSFTYKRFSLDFLLQFVKQRGPGLNYGYQTYSNGILKNKDLSALERWQNPGDETPIPGAARTPGTAIYDAYQNQYRLSDANWVDASFIRLKNISLRYNFADVLKHRKVNNVSVYVQGQNLFTITSYKGFDPETKGFALPILRVYTAGFQLTF